MNRAVLIATGIIILAVLAGALYFLFLPGVAPHKSGSNEDPSPGGFPISPGAPTELRRSIPAEGGSVETLDFLEGTETVALSENPQDVQHNLTPYEDYVPGQPYPEHAFDVQYNALNGEFVITLNQEPLKNARLEAEAFLRRELGVPDDELCRLYVTVGVPYSVNANYSAYQNLGLSFCPDPFPLP